MKCNHCNREIDDNSQFCPHCGVKTQQQSTPKPVRSTEEINKKIKLYKALLGVVSVLMLAMPILFGSWGIVGLIILLGVDAFLGIKIAQFNRDKDLIKYNYSQYNTSDPFGQDSQVAPMDNLNSKEDREITSYLRLDNICLTICSIGLVVFGLLLLFVPFFSVIIEDVSIYNLAESSFIWNLFADKEFVYAELLNNILQEGTITSFLHEQDVDNTYFGVSFLLFFFIPICSAIACGRSFYNSYKYKTDSNFKNAIIYKYNNAKAPSYTFGTLILLAILTVLFLPALGFLVYLPTYFIELTNAFYFIVLACFLLFYIFMFLYPLFLQRKYKQAMFALKPIKK